jgi:ATP-dependent Clp protease ATP-binding subunit ClpB
MQLRRHSIQHEESKRSRRRLGVIVDTLKSKEREAAALTAVWQRERAARRAVSDTKERLDAARHRLMTMTGT